MNGCHINTQRDSGMNCFSCGIGNVVEFQIKKNARTSSLNLANDGRPFCREKLQADLEKAPLTRQLVHQFEGGLGIRGVDGDNDLIFSGVWHG